MDGFYIFFITWILLALLGLGVRGLIDGVTFGEVRDRFVRLGDMTGKTFDEIVRAIGRNPTSVNAVNGTMIATWLEHNFINSPLDANFYSITISFVDGAFNGILSENAMTLGHELNLQQPNVLTDEEASRLWRQ